jgi:hypothetical protein
MSASSQLFGDELLSAVFANFDKKGFRTTQAKLTTIFHDLLVRPEFKTFAGQYPFDTDGPEPRSKALSDALDSLQQSRLVGRMNPDLVLYQITDALHARYVKYIEPKLKRKKRLIKRLAQEVESRL